jgi:hypothetical protein
MQIFDQDVPERWSECKKMHVVDIRGSCKQQQQQKKMRNIGNVDAHMRNVYLLKCSWKHTHTHESLAYKLAFFLCCVPPSLTVHVVGRPGNR